VNNKKSIKAIISGGGTGGHIFPAVAIANELMRQNPDNEILFVGALGKMEMERVPQEGYKIIGLPIAGLNRTNPLKNLSLPFKLFKSYLISRSIIKQLKPDIVIGVGGYASFSIMRMAQRYGIPTLLQEQNSYAGKSNKILSKLAKKICVAYDNMDRFFPKENIVYTGNPVRALITNSNATQEQGLNHFGLTSTKKTILIIGGSLGAKAINDTMIAQNEKWSKNGIQVIWQTGKLSFAAAQQSVSGRENDIKVFDFIKEMDLAYAAADVVISRAGALSISELCILGKPAILVPLPTAAEDHQTVNAMTLVNANAGMIVKNNETDEQLIETTLALLKNEEQMLTMSSNILFKAVRDADEKIVNEIYKVIV
jgi:UDP-N-acetylglucosamine--N-acetylmuramyl-(pentapeptide) pyrophosphoryl-undecaprenol N-acetylglucosamine transferase